MSQGPYPPGYESADGAPPPGRPPYEPYEPYDDRRGEPPTGRASARVPQQPEWPPPGERPDRYPPPQQQGGWDQTGYAAPTGSFGNPPTTYGAPPAGRPAGSASVPGPGGYPPADPPGRGPNPPGTYGGGQYGTPPGERNGQYPPPGQHGGAGEYDRDGQYDRPESSRFSSLRYDDEPGPGAPAPAKSKRGLIIGVVIAAVVVLVLAAVGVTYFLSSQSSGTTYAVGSCVQKSGDKAVGVACSASGAYQILSRVDAPSKCPDPAQPYVVLQEKGKPDQVLCLKPAH
jgi:hypothetical protein